MTLAAIVAAASTIVLLRWLVGIDIDPDSGFATTKFNTAFGFLLGATALGARSSGGGRLARRITLICSTLLLALAALTLFEYTADVEFGIDLLVVDDPATPADLFPGRMSFATALALAFLAAALMVIDVRTSAQPRPAEPVVLAAIAIGLAALFGYVFDADALYGAWLFSTMAIPTALLVLALGIGIVFAHPAHGLVAIFTSPHAGGRIARYLLPGILILPAALSWACLQGVAADLYAAEFGFALTALTGTLLLFALTWWGAGYLNSLEINLEQRAQHSAHLAAIVESSDVGIISRDLDGYIRSWNKGAQRLFGFSEEEMIGQHITRIIPEDRHAEELAIIAAVKRGESTEHLETMRLRKDGTLSEVSISVSPIRDDAGKLVGASKIVRDISQRKRAEEALVRRTTELARSNEDLEQFAYVASHDLQEPLRAVSGCVQLLRNRYQDKLDEKADELILHSVSGVERMQTLINDLLSYSRVSRSGDPRVPVDVGAALDEAVENLSASIEESGAAIAHADLPAVRAVHGELVILFQNLIGNAIKFRRPDVAPKIRIAAVARDELWQFSVADNGIGIEREYFDRVFVIFQRLHTRSAYPGTGIGLPMCKKIVERHGGRIWIESDPGEGTTFHFTLQC